MVLVLQLHGDVLPTLTGKFRASSATHHQSDKQTVDRSEPKRPPMLEHYLQEEDPWKEFLARSAKQNNEKTQKKDKEQMNKGVDPGKPASLKAGQKGEPFVKYQSADNAG